MALEPLFFFQARFPLLNENQIQIQTCTLLDSEPTLASKYKIKVVKKDVMHSFFALEAEPAVDIRLFVNTSDKVSAFFKALGAFFKGRNRYFELTPNGEAITEFFQFRDQEGVEDLQAAHQQGKTVHIYVGLNPNYRRLHCIVTGGDALKNIYKRAIKGYVFQQTPIDRKIYFLLNKFLMVRELNFSYRIAALRTLELVNDEEKVHAWELSQKAFSQSMLNLSRSFAISAEKYVALLRVWQRTHPERTEEEIQETVDAFVADPSLENVIGLVSRDTYLYPVWTHLVERIIMEDLHTLFQTEGAHQPLVQRLAAIPNEEVELFDLVQSMEDACLFTKSLNALSEIFVKFRFFLTTTRAILPHKREAI